MKIVQSFWNAHRGDLFMHKGGFLCPEIHWMSWAFSCLQLRKFYTDVEMYTDTSGKAFFELLGFPYTKIHTTMEDDPFMKRCHPQMWAYAKIHAYAQQTAPFLHIDGDAFIWAPFDDEFIQSPLFAHSFEDNDAVYRILLNDVKKLPDVPEWVYWEDKDPHAYNAGILGGNDMEPMKEYIELAYDFYERNRLVFDNHLTNVKNFQMIPEQYLFYALGKRKNIKMGLYDTNYEQDYVSRLADIAKIPHESKFMHILGEVKQDNHQNYFVNYMLQKDYPDSWQRIVEAFKQHGQLSPFMENLLDEKYHQKTVLIPSIATNDDAHKQTKMVCDLLRVNFEEVQRNGGSDNAKIQDIYTQNEIGLMDKNDDKNSHILFNGQK
ncbi:MAG: hypothetical protein LBT48_03160 [Prevotellaceae bacterium]|jgi:hypothetical protein|nr:hypothetical protein [Prevotellaceae bacterium]